MINSANHAVNKGVGHVANRIEFGSDLCDVPDLTQIVKHFFKTISTAQVCHPHTKFALKYFFGTSKTASCHTECVYGTVAPPAGMVRWCTGQLKTHLITKEVNRLKGKLPQIPKALVRTSAESPISLAATQADANGAIIPVA